MNLYSKNNTSLSKLKSIPFKLEKDIQNIVEANLSTLFELELIKSEHPHGNYRFDTLCFDNDTKSFVIIEYKKGSSYSVIDQGYTYLSQLLNHKSDFILELNETLGRSLKRDEIDWSQSRIIFVSPKFSDYQKNSVNFKNIPFELWEISRFENDLISLNRVHTDSQEDISQTVSGEGDSMVGKVNKEIITYDEDFHVHKKSKSRPADIVEMYNELRDRVLQIGSDVSIKCSKLTIGFKANKVFTDFIIYDRGIGVMLNVKKGKLKNDFRNLTRDMSEVGHWGNGDYKITIKPDSVDLDYVMSLIKESYQQQQE